MASNIRISNNGTIYLNDERRGYVYSGHNWADAYDENDRCIARVHYEQDPIDAISEMLDSILH